MARMRIITEIRNRVSKTNKVAAHAVLDKDPLQVDPVELKDVPIKLAVPLGLQDLNQKTTLPVNNI